MPPIFNCDSYKKPVIFKFCSLVSLIFQTFSVLLSYFFFGMLFLIREVFLPFLPSTTTWTGSGVFVLLFLLLLFLLVSSLVLFIFRSLMCSSTRLASPLILLFLSSSSYASSLSSPSFSPWLNCCWCCCCCCCCCCCSCTVAGRRWIISIMLASPPPYQRVGLQFDPILEQLSPAMTQVSTAVNSLILFF